MKITAATEDLDDLVLLNVPVNPARRLNGQTLKLKSAWLISEFTSLIISCKRG
ncbi:MAG: hypothetical protein ACLTSJ_09910 [Alistipes communis]